jgi:hypothetical protein
VNKLNSFKKELDETKKSMEGRDFLKKNLEEKQGILKGYEKSPPKDNAELKTSKAKEEYTLAFDQYTLKNQDTKLDIKKVLKKYPEEFEPALKGLCEGLKVMGVNFSQTFSFE